MTVRKVLVVEDSAPQLKNLEDIVLEAGCTVITATSGREAIEQTKSGMPDLILMDIVMDDMDGYSACREILKDESTKHIPVVFVTTKNNKADRMWAERQGGKDMISKPYTKEQIFEQINRY